MKSLLFIGGPLIAFLGFSLYSDLLTYGDQSPGMVHMAGVPLGGTFILQKDTYVCEGDSCTLVDSKTEFSEVSGLELEEQAIEYREGSGEGYNKTKQPGVSKYTNIHLKRPTGFDTKSWKFVFERQAAIEEVEKEFDEKLE
jgi:hypothetical protein